MRYLLPPLLMFSALSPTAGALALLAFLVGLIVAALFAIVGRWGRRP